MCPALTPRSKSLADIPSPTPFERRLLTALTQAQLSFVQQAMLTLSLLPRPETTTADRPRSDKEKEYIRTIREQMSQVRHFLTQTTGEAERKALESNLEELEGELARCL